MENSILRISVNRNDLSKFNVKAINMVQDKTDEIKECIEVLGQLLGDISRLSFHEDENIELFNFKLITEDETYLEVSCSNMELSEDDSILIHSVLDIISNLLIGKESDKNEH